MHELDNNWTFWLHLPHDIDWSIGSYKKLYSFNTLEDCITLIENINKLIVEKCMLFIMKNNIKPIWEDKKNCNGGCFSYKILTENVYEIWKQLVYYLVGNTLSNNNELLTSINGISISPKKNFCIIKLWLDDIEKLKNNEIYDFLKASDTDDTKAETNLDINSYDPFNLNKLCNIDPQICKFKKHEVLYKS